MSTPSGHIRVGIAAWSDIQDFYPTGVKPADRISYYARVFSVVEVTAGYYHLLPTKNYESWVNKTPDDFRFNVKAYGELTGHHRGEPAPAITFEHFRESYGPVREAGKLGAVLFQFPPWFESNDANRREITRCVELMGNDSLLIEFRNVSWLEPDERARTHDFLTSLDVSYVTVDAPQVGRGTAQLVPDVTNPNLAYLRLHGRNVDTWYKRGPSAGERFNYLYGTEEMDDLAAVARQLARQASEVNVVFNNNMHGYAVTNARQIMNLLDVPLVDLDADAPRQRRLL